MRILALSLLALLAGATPAAAGAVATTGGVSTSVREQEGTLVFSQYDPADTRFHLAIREPGKTARRVAVAPGVVPFQADIGTDSAGRPQLIYVRCARGWSAEPSSGLTPGPPIPPSGCDLYVFSLTAATGERPVRNANDPARDDVGPTLWRGRIAWVREYESGPVVYTKLLSAPRSRPSTRLPGVPTRRCAEDADLVDPPCGATRDRGAGGLELWGDRLAMVVGYTFSGLGGISQSEVRLDRVSTRTAQQVAFLSTGLNGQHLSGPSFTGGRLGWYRSCSVEDMACRTFNGPWRYRISTRRYERGAAGPGDMSGYADAGTRLYEQICGFAAASLLYAAPTTACPIASVAPPAFSGVPAPDLAPSTPPT